MNEIVEFQGWMVALAGAVVAGLFALVGWLASEQVKSLKREMEELKGVHRASVEQLGVEINAVGRRLNDFQLEVARECINGERLRAALEPFNSRLDEIKTDVRQVGERVDKLMSGR